MGMKILYIDLETAPGVAYFWGLFDKFIPIDRVISPGRTLCFAAQWEGEKKIHFYSEYADGRKAMVQAAWDMLEEADVVIHYNGKKFDVPMLNKEFVLAGLRPPSDYHQIDLYQVVRRQFRFDSNKLDFVLKQLGLEQKVSHKGMALWTECMEGDAKAWKAMAKYNKQDVRIMPALYEVLKPWIKSHPNRALWSGTEERPTCPTCGSKNVRKHGIRRTRVTAYQRYLCSDCGTSSRGRKQLEKTEEGVLT